MASNDSNKKPACDNCKNRKTKCDRKSPCSSCVVAELDCRIVNRAPEKRQRILISANYDKAMESVDRSLQEISRTLQKLMQNQGSPQEKSSVSPTAFVNSRISDVSGTTEGYSGDSSFTAHVQRAKDALGESTTSSILGVDVSGLPQHENSACVVSGASNGETLNSLSDRVPSLVLQVDYLELESRSLPLIDTVLKLLRLAQKETQRFFVDVPVINEHDFGELCQKVYFAIHEYSLSAWITVNAGLHFLFTYLREPNYSQVGVTTQSIEEFKRLLSGNLDAATQALRLCQDPSLEACQALAILAQYYLKSGRNTVAWSLVASASRMCIDLGWHRMPHAQPGSKISSDRIIFWQIFFLDKGLAFTLGRTPSIHQYDVSTERPSSTDRSDVPGFLYLGFFEYALIVGDMHMRLFSASALRESPEQREQSARSLASRLVQVNSDAKQTVPGEPPIDEMFQATGVLLDIIMHCLMTIVYRIIPCSGTNVHPLQCNTECILAARRALFTIVEASQAWGLHNQEGWTMFLNLLFSLVPFACFIVLAGNAIAVSSSEDLELLSAVVSTIEPIANNSPSGKRLCDVCKSFYQFASFSVAQNKAPQSTINNFVETETSLYDHVMAPQDWDTVMDEFEIGVGAGEMASFVEPYMPFDGRWA